MVTRVLRRAGAPVVVVALVCLAGLSLSRVYNGSFIALLVAGAAVGSVLVSALLRRAPAWLVAVVSVAAMAGYVILAVGTSAASGGVVGDLPALVLDATRNAVPRLLTALIPVEAQPDTVLGPVVLAWLAGFAGAELAARAARPAVALVPPTLLYAGVLILVGPNATVVVWQPLAFAALAALALVVRGPAPGARTLPGLGAPERAVLRLRTASGLAIGLACVLATVAVAAPLVARTVHRTPSDPRAFVEPPSLDVLDQNPLIRVSGWAVNPEQRLFDVMVLRGANPPDPQPAPAANGDHADGGDAPGDGADAPVDNGDAPVDNGDAPVEEGVAAEDGAYDTRLRLAVLADWDGVTWHMQADYRNAGRVLPPVAPPPGRAAEEAPGPPPLTIEERITVGELQGRLMPAVSAPRRVEGVRVAYDESTGTLVNAVPLVAGLQYTVTSINSSLDVNLLEAVDVPSGPATARYLAVGDAIPADLSGLAERISTSESSPYLRALALEAFISEHYQYAADAPSGHAYPNLRFFLFADPRAGGQRGTSEQFATAFAALGRLMGLPTRVVVGFSTPAGGGAVTGADALAWPEVLFDEVGWVAFDPMPHPDTPPRPLEDEFLPKPPPPTSPPASVEPSDELTGTAPPPSPEAAAIDPDGPRAGAVAGSAGGALIVVLLVMLSVVALMRMMLRRRRLDRGSPSQRVLGAWDEVLDALVLAGTPPPAHLAAAEVATHAVAVAQAAPGRRHARRPRPPVPPLADLAAKVNAVGFASGVAGFADADELAALTAKIQAVGYARALRARRSWWRRLLWRVDPRPLRRAPRR